MTTSETELATVKAEMERLKEAGAVILGVEFAGEGDEGSIQSTWAVTAKEELIPIQEENALDDWAYNYIERHCPIDWYNNEGGQGELSVDLLTGEVKLTSSYNESVSHNAEPYTGVVE